MRKKIEFKWETINITATSETLRTKVIGGWIFHTLVSNGKIVSSSSVFIADRDHEWTIVQPGMTVDSPKATPVSEGF